MSWMDFNDADEQKSGDVIPAGTIAKVVLKIRPGGYNDPAMGLTGGLARRSDKTGAIMLDCEYTVMGGKYDKRKVWSNIGIFSAKGPEWGNMGRAFVRAALESARGIRPDDMSEAAQKARQINSMEDLNGLTFVAKIEVDKPQEGYEAKNIIQRAVPVTHRDYAAAMSGTGGAQASLPGVAAPVQKPAGGSSTPAWAV